MSLTSDVDIEYDDIEKYIENAHCVELKNIVCMCVERCLFEDNEHTLIVPEEALNVFKVHKIETDKYGDPKLNVPYYYERDECDYYIIINTDGNVKVMPLHYGIKLKSIVCTYCCHGTIGYEVTFDRRVYYDDPFDYKTIENTETLDDLIDHEWFKCNHPCIGRCI